MFIAKVFGMSRGLLTIMRRATFYGMMPLALWGGLPSTGCFCADGHFEFACTQHLKIREGTLPVAARPAAEPCSHCCQQHAVSPGAVSRGSERQDCATCHPAGLQTVPSCNGCCTPAASAKVVAPLSELVQKSSAPAVHVDLAFDLASPAAAPISVRVDWADTGPPDDLVIELRCLRI